MWLSTPSGSQNEKAELRSFTSSGASNQSYEIPLSLEVQVFHHTIFHPPLVLRMPVNYMDNSLSHIYRKLQHRTVVLLSMTFPAIILGDILAIQ